MSTRRKNPEMFDHQVQLHTFLCQDSSAVKLRHTSENFRTFLKTEIRRDEVVGTHIIDVAEGSSTAKEGTLYVQCLAEHKPKVTAYLKTYLTLYSTKYPDDREATIVYPRSQTSDNSASATQTINTWSRNQAYFYKRLAAPQDPPLPPHSIPGAVSFADMAAGRYNRDKINPVHSELSSPTNSRSTIPSIREQQLEERIRVLEAQLLKATSSQSPSLSISSKSTQSSIRSVKTTKFQVIMAQQMQMIQSLADSIKTNNERMEQQMDIITDLRQTVAELVIKINNRDADSSTITSSDQRKRSKISHNVYKHPLTRRHHPSNSGTNNTLRVPPDPNPDTSQAQNQDSVANEADQMSDESTHHKNEDTLTPEAQETYGGIQDDDILEHMAQTCEAMNTIHQDNENHIATCGQQEKC